MKQRSRFFLSFLLSCLIVSEVRPADPVSWGLAALAVKTVVTPVAGLVVGMASLIALRRDNRLQRQTAIANDALKSQPKPHVTQTVTASQSQPTNIDTKAVQPAVRDYTGPSMHESTNIEHQSTVNVGTDAVSALNLVHDLGNLMFGISDEEKRKNRAEELEKRKIKIPEGMTVANPDCFLSDAELKAKRAKEARTIPYQAGEEIKFFEGHTDLSDQDQKLIQRVHTYSNDRLVQREGNLNGWKTIQEKRMQRHPQQATDAQTQIDGFNKELQAIQQERVNRVKKQAITTGATYMVLTTQTVGTTASTIVEPEKKPMPGCPPATPVEVVKATTSPATPMNPEPNPGFSIVNPEPLKLINVPFEQKSEDFILTAEKLFDKIKEDGKKERYKGPWYERTEDWHNSLPDDLKKSILQTKELNNKKRMFEVQKRFGDLKKGDLVVIDGLHKDHLEVFNKQHDWKFASNFDGTKNEQKTDKVPDGRKVKS